MLTDKELAAVPEELLEDLLRYFPRDYEDRRRFSTVAAAPVDTPVCLELLVAEPPHLSRIRIATLLARCYPVALTEADVRKLRRLGQKKLRQA